MARRTDLHKKLADDLDNLRNQGGETSGDPVDAAFESGSEEMASQLAELDARELRQIERALTRLKQGTYGACEACGGKIPVGRLNAVPYTTMCINCQREMEQYPGWHSRDLSGSWEKVYDSASSLEEPREVDLADLETDLSK